MKNKTYRGFVLTYWAKPIPYRDCDYDFCHEDYDGPGDPRCGSGPSIADCRDQIDEILLDLEEAE